MKSIGPVHRVFLKLCVIATGLTTLSSQAADPPVSTYWLERHGLTANDLVFDFDNDGYSTRTEFYFGTDPLDDQSAMEPRFTGDAQLTLLEWDSVGGVAYQLEQSDDLKTWNTLGGTVLGTGETFELEIDPGLDRALYRFKPTVQDSDGDCLYDFEEIYFSGTDPHDADSDDDGLSDGDEVKTYRTDPNYASPTGRGTIRGRVVYDEDGDPTTRSHPGLPDWTVFIDRNLDGSLNLDEHAIETSPDGSFAFEELDPGFYRVCAARPAGWAQVFPETDAPYSADGYPDVVAEMIDSGKGSLPMPYGINQQSPVEHKLLLGLSQEPVDPSIVLGQLPNKPYTPPLGLWSDVDFMGIPEGGSITLEFANEEIIDGPGIDLVVASLDQPAGEKGLIYLGRTQDNFQLAGQFDEGGDLGIDLSALGIAPPIHFVKLEALDNLGAVQGFDLLGMQAIHYQPPPRGHYDIDLTGGAEVTGIDFGVRGADRPPYVSVHSVDSQVLEGETINLKVTTSDDLGITNQSLRVNGSPVTLNDDGEATYATNYAGILNVEANAEDTGGQQATSELQLLVLHEDGSLPDLSGLGLEATQDEDAPQIILHSPYAGEILDAPTPVIASILPSHTTISQWCVEYASTSLVDPESLESNDPDYLLLAQGSGTINNQAIATIPADSLDPDTYLIRIKAIGGTTAYFGAVVAVGLEEEDIRPQIDITSPEVTTEITYLTDIVGSITTKQTLREWSLEYAPLSEVNLENIGDPSPDYTEIASGNSPLSDSILGTFDPTTLPNDAYLVRVTAWNTNGLGWTEGVILNVTGQAKLGNFAVTFTDLSLPCAGIPIEIKRIYDSLNADVQGTFGYGWRLGANDANILETIPQAGSGFLATPFQIGTRVYLTTPEGRRVGFTFDVEAGPSGFIGTAYSAKFHPDPGVEETLEVPEGDTAFLSVTPTGEVSLFFINTPFNPNVYVLTDRQGLRHTYDQFKGLLEIEDPNGNKVIFTDDGVEHSNGSSLLFGRDAEGRITSITGPDGQRWQYGYDTKGDLSSVTYPDGEIATFGYTSDRDHFLTTYENAFGMPSQTIEYDANGRIRAIIDAEGNRSEQSWDPEAFVGTFTDARGHVTTYEHDALGNIVRQINPDGGGEITYQYNDPAHPFLETAITDPNGHTTTFAYDAKGNLVERVEPLSGVTRWDYDDQGNIIRVVPPHGQPIEIEYNASHLPVLYRLGSTLREYHLSYTTSGLLATYEDPEGGLTHFEYDGPWSTPSRTTYPNGQTQTVVLNDFGTPVTVTDAFGATRQFVYDAMQRITTSIDPLGESTTTTYYKDHLPASQTDRLNRTTSYHYSQNDLLERIELPDGSTITYTYDANGNRTSLTDALGNRTEYAYDTNNRLVEEVDPNEKRRTFQYDLAGNRVALVDRNERKRSFVYDALNRMTEEHWHDPMDDSILQTLTFGYDRLHRMTSADAPGAALAFSWTGNPGGKMQSERVTLGQRAPLEISFDYDHCYRLTRLGYMGSLHAVRYERDRSGRAAIVKLDRGANTTSARWDQEFDGLNRVRATHRFADLQATLLTGSTIKTFDPRGWTNAITHHNSLGAVHGHSSIDYTRNAEGEITRRVKNSTTIDYGYDATGQLTSAMLAASSGVQENYQYDVNGNRLVSNLNGNYQVGTGNRITQAGDWTIDYDGEGNLIRRTHTTSGEIKEYEYDHRNRLTCVRVRATGSDPEVVLAEYLYDALDRRTAVIRSNQTLWTYHADEHPFLEYLDEESDVFRMHVYGDDIDALIGMWHRTHGTLHALTDQLETVHQWLDVSGDSVGTFEYDSFGNILTTTGINDSLLQPTSYTGRQWDRDTELYYYRARYYDPSLGRFLSEDPIGFEGDRSNVYRYADNRPLIARDPSGKTSYLETALLSVYNLPSDIWGRTTEAIIVLADDIRNLIDATIALSTVALEELGDLMGSIWAQTDEAITAVADALRTQIDQEIEKASQLLRLVQP